MGGPGFLLEALVENVFLTLSSFWNPVVFVGWWSLPLSSKSAAERPQMRDSDVLPSSYKDPVITWAYLDNL